MTWLLGVVHPRNGKVPTLFLFVQGGGGCFLCMSIFKILLHEGKQSILSFQDFYSAYVARSGGGRGLEYGCLEDMVWVT